MKEQNETNERIRKARSARGERSQHTMSFRLDNELTAWLNQHLNKGRYINELIKADKDRQTRQP